MRNIMNKGMTILEVFVMIAIITMLSVVIYSSFSEYRKVQTLKNETERLSVLIDEARSRTLSSENSMRYGVHFSGDKAVLFEGTSYTEGAASNEVQEVSSGVSITDISLEGGGSAVLFDRLTGATSNYGTITLYVDAEHTRVITIGQTGLIENN